MQPLQPTVQHNVHTDVDCDIDRIGELPVPGQDIYGLGDWAVGGLRRQKVATTRRSTFLRGTEIQQGYLQLENSGLTQALCSDGVAKLEKHTS